MATRYILDGYNIIKQDDVWADLTLADGRQALLAMLMTKRPHGSRRNQVLVVFDGQPDVWGGAALGDEGVRVVFTTGETADAYIRRLIEDSREVKNMIVVTDDREIQVYVRGLGARVKPVKEFLGVVCPAKRGPVRREKEKDISVVVERRINAELESVWLKKKPKE